MWGTSSSHTSLSLRRVGDSVVAATSSRRAVLLPRGGAAASDHVGCFSPRKLLSLFFLLDRYEGLPGELYGAKASASVDTLGAL